MKKLKEIAPKAFVIVSFKSKRWAKYFYKNAGHHVFDASKLSYREEDPSGDAIKFFEIENILNTENCECEANDGQYEWMPCLKCRINEVIDK